MAIDLWFPLAIYYADLPEGSAHKEAITGRIRAALETPIQKRTTAPYAWTGDVHGVDQFHAAAALGWLTGQVGLHAREYLQALGHDLSKIELYIQRSWPVVSRPGQQVARHAHHTAHLSAVYYVSVPAGNSGATRFYNEARQNELSAGVGSAMTGGYAQYNALNLQSAAYQPVEGRLLLFPARQPHDVGINETGEERLSISYDLVLASRAGAAEGGYEFLMPPPAQWQRLDLPEANPPAPPLPDGNPGA